MTKLEVVTFASIAAILFCPTVFSAEPNSIPEGGLTLTSEWDQPVVFNVEPNSIPGEKLDSGLGSLPSSYAATEFQRSAAPAGYAVLGEKLDSGLGDLSPSYAATEFQRSAVPAGYAVLGEKLDSGLGDLSPSYAAAEFQRAANQPMVAGYASWGKGWTAD